jgi:hypothetical protein
MPLHIGDRGKAETSLQPQGFVWVEGERYDARAEASPVDAGTEVVVVGGNHMGLVVRPLERGRSPELPDCGKPVCVSFDEHTSRDDERREEERQRWLTEHRRVGTIAAAIVGGVAAAAAVWLAWGFLGQQVDQPAVLALGLIAGGAVYGVGLFRLLDELFGEIDPNLRRATHVSTALAIIGTAVGAALAVPAVGILGGLAMAFVGALVLAALPPLVLCLSGMGDG